MTIKHLFPTSLPELNLDFANAKQLDPRITFTRLTTGTYIDENGIVQTAAVDEARFDHAGDGKCLGLLIEEAKTNLVTYSEDLGNWTSTLWTITTDAIAAPDGNTTADLAVPNLGTSTQSRSVTVSVTAGVQYVATIFAKAKEMTSFNLRPTGSNSYRCTFTLTGSGTATPINGSGSITALPNGWYRCVYAFTEPTGGSRQFGVQTDETSDGVSGFYVWGAQLEQGSFPTSYIPTDGTPGGIARGADIASMTGTNFSSWYNQSEGTVFCTAQTAEFGGNKYVLHTYGASGTNNRGGYYLNSSNRPSAYWVNAGANQALLQSSTPAGGFLNEPFRYAAAYGTDDFALSHSGGNLIVDTSGTPDPTIYRANIGSFGPSPISFINGHISRITYYPYRLTNAQLEALTL